MERSSSHMRSLALADRPRERLLAAGPAHLTSEELVALLLGSGGVRGGALELARRLLGEVGGVEGLASRSPAALLGAGVGPAKAARIAAAFELARRGEEARWATGPQRPRLASSRELADRFGGRLRREPGEVLLLVLLTPGLRLVRAVELARGTRTSAVVSTETLFARVLQEGARRFALLHNHPNGDPTPSAEDRAFTLRVAAAAALLGVELVDHVILGAPERVYSFADAGSLSEEAV